MPAVSGMGIHPIKLKEPGLQTGSFNFSIYSGGEEKSPYEANFITHFQNMLDATPTPPTRLRNVIYEPFLSKTNAFAVNGLAFILQNLYRIFTIIGQAHDMLRFYSSKTGDL